MSNNNIVLLPVLPIIPKVYDDSSKYKKERMTINLRTIFVKSGVKTVARMSI